MSHIGSSMQSYRSVNPKRPIELYTAMKHAYSISEEGESNLTEYRSLKRRELADSCNDGNRSDGLRQADMIIFCVCSGSIDV
jgi:hypothetical protein